jgi:antitoxin MazE
MLPHEFNREAISMQTALRKMGNSTGMILPKPILAALGISSGTRIELEVDNGRVIATPVKRAVREGWAEDAKLIAAEGLTEEEEDWLGFGNDGDDELTW